MRREAERLLIPREGLRNALRLPNGMRFGCACLVATLLGACSADEADTIATSHTTAALSTSSFTGSTLPSKTLALTFDDGPSIRTSELSSYLKAQGIHATFFVIGGHVGPTTLPNPHDELPVADAAAILAQVVADGHLVANHTTTHRDLVAEVPPNEWLAELADTDARIQTFVPSGHFLFRPPHGSWSKDVADANTPSMNKYVGPVTWNIGGDATAYPLRAADWACWQGALLSGSHPANGTGHATTTECGDAYLSEIRKVGRGIVLMHDPYSWAQGNTVDMVKYIVPTLKQEGWSFVRADEVPDVATTLGGASAFPDGASAPPSDTAASPATSDPSASAALIPPPAPTTRSNDGGCAVSSDAPPGGAVPWAAAMVLFLLRTLSQRQNKKNPGGTNSPGAQ